MRRQNGTWIAVFAGLLLVAGTFAGTLADDKQHDQHGEHSEHEEHGGHGEHKHGGDTKIPETAAEIWHAIGEQSERLDSTIDSGKLADVHEIAFAIRDLANALPGTTRS